MSTTDTAAKPAPKKKKAGGSFKGEFYRQMRLWHGYLSAFAFVALMFFSATGLFLNHPEWFKPASKTAPVVNVMLSPAELAQAKAAKDPAHAIADVVGKKTKLVGVFSSGEVLDGSALIRLESVKGSSDLEADLTSGKVGVTVERHDTVTVINELHRGKNGSPAWKLVIDAVAIVVLCLSVLGYILFFSLRFRLRTSLILTAVSIVAMIGVFLFLTP
jgi:hypothetical protein